MIDKESTFPIIIAGIFVMVAIIAATIVHCSYQGVYEIDMFNADGTIAKRFSLTVRLDTIRCVGLSHTSKRTARYLIIYLAISRSSLQKFLINNLRLVVFID